MRLSWSRLIAAAAILCAPLSAGDYDHLLDVVKGSWPDRTVAMALCDKDANQAMLAPLADTAKARNLTLVVVDLKAQAEYGKTIVTALQQKPGFFILVDGDALTGLKGPLAARMVYRAAQTGVPTVSLSKDALKLGAVLATGPGAADPVYGAKEAAARLNVTLPADAVEPTAAKKKAAHKK